MSRRQSAAEKFGGICECGDHAWAKLTKGYVTIVDPEDAHLLQRHAWVALIKPRETVYAISQFGRRNYRYLHREIMQPPIGLIVDHIWGDGIDNRKRRMRVTTRGVNAQNRNRLSRQNTSGVIGVSWREAYSDWVVHVAANGKQRYIGSFKTVEDAAKASAEARAKYQPDAIRREQL